MKNLKYYIPLIGIRFVKQDCYRNKISNNNIVCSGIIQGTYIAVIVLIPLFIKLLNL